MCNQCKPGETCVEDFISDTDENVLDFDDFDMDVDTFIDMVRDNHVEHCESDGTQNEHIDSACFDTIGMSSEGYTITFTCVSCYKDLGVILVRKD